MLIVLSKKNDTALIEHIQDLLKRKYDCKSHVIGENGRIIAVPGDTSSVNDQLFRAMEGVKAVDRVDPPYKLASRKQKNRTEIELKPGCVIGSRDQLVVMAGPCSIESRDQLDEAAAMAKEQGVQVLRGGAYKPRTGPYAFNGLGEDGLKLLKEISAKYDMATVSEAMTEEQIDLVSEYCDIIQIGARNMQNYDLLRKAGTIQKPVMLKRGLAATLDEWLLAAEYILAGGNEKVILCERGIRTFEKKIRFTLPLGSLPPLRELTHLPIVVDPTHAAGVSRYVADNANASIAAGADGLIIEIHPRPEEALSDAPQQLDSEQWSDCMEGVRKVAAAVDRTVV